MVEFRVAHTIMKMMKPLNGSELMKTKITLYRGALVSLLVPSLILSFFEDNIAVST